MGNTNGAQERSFFQLQDGARLEAKYDITTKVTQWDIFGSADINALELKVMVTISTNEVMFPASWYYRYSFHTLEDGTAAAVTSAVQKFKILPGSAITVGKGVTFSVPEIFVYGADYKDPQDGSTAAHSSYESNKGAGQLIVNGTLKANKIGGFVSTTEEGAKIEVLEDAQATSYELRSISGGNAYWTDYNKYLELKVYSESAGKLSDRALKQTVSGEQSFTSQDGGWISKYFYIEYKANGDERGGEISGNSEDAYEGNSVTGSTITTEMPKRAYHVFTGWYYNAACTEKVGDSTKTVSAGDVVTVYAGWKALEYTLKYEITYLGGAGEADVATLTWEYGTTTQLPDLFDKVPGFNFSGWFLDSNFSDPIVSITDETIDRLTVSDLYNEGTITLYAKFVKDGMFSVQYDNGGRYNDELIGTEQPLPTDHLGTQVSAVSDIAKATEIIEGIDDYTHEYYFTGWTSKQSGKAITAETSIEAGDLTNGVLVLTAQWAQKAYVTVAYNIGTMSNASVEFTSPISLKAESNINYYFRAGEPVTIKITLGGLGNDKLAQVSGAASGNFSEKNSVSDKTFTMPEAGKKVTITAKCTGTCIIEGTLITLADGTQKKVEDLLPTDLVLVFNHETGKYEACALWSNVHAGNAAEWFTVTYLKFSDSTELGINNEHALFDKTLNRYVYFNASNPAEYIGHKFVTVQNVNGKYVSGEVTLVGFENRTEYLRVFSPVSLFHMNVVTNGLLSMTAWPTNSEGFENYFAYDEDMKFNEAAMQEDIEKYGLYTYEDFKDLMTEDLFNALPWKYFKIAVGKGMMTWDEILYTIDWIYTTGQIQLD